MTAASRTIIRTPEAHDFLALVPQLAGFRPENSVVLVAFRGNRTCGALRFDLPAGEREKVHRRIATTLVGLLSKIAGVDAVVPVIYTDDRFASVIPHERFMRSIITRARFSGFLVRDALCVASDGWASYLDDDYPDGGRSLDLIESSAVAIRPEVKRVGDVREGGTLPEVAFDRRERVARRFHQLKETIDDDGFDAIEVDFPGLTDFPLMMDHLLTEDAGELDEEFIALLIVLLQPPPIRDAVMLLWAFDLETGDRMFDLNERFSAGEDITGDPDGALMMGEGPRPDPERIEAAITLLKTLAAHAPRSAKPPLLCMLTWLCWALGRGSVAGLFLARVTDIAPDYSMGRLLSMMVERGILPEWAFSIPSDDEAYGSRPVSGRSAAP